MIITEIDYFGIVALLLNNLSLSSPCRRIKQISQFRECVLSESVLKLCYDGGSGNTGLVEGIKFLDSCPRLGFRSSIHITKTLKISNSYSKHSYMVLLQMTVSNLTQNLNDSDIRGIYEDLLKKGSKFPISFLSTAITPSQVNGKHIRFVRHKIFQNMSEPKFADLLKKETGRSDISSLMLRRYETYGKPDAKKPKPPSQEVGEFIVAVIQSLQDRVAEVIPNISTEKANQEKKNRQQTLRKDKEVPITASHPREEIRQQRKTHSKTKDEGTEMIFDRVTEINTQEEKDYPRGSMATISFYAPHKEKNIPKRQDHLETPEKGRLDDHHTEECIDERKDYEETQKEGAKTMLKKLTTELNSLKRDNLSEMWRSYLKETPTPSAISNAEEVLEELKNFNSLLDSSRLDCKVVPSVNGGIGISFFNGKVYADIECFNTGEILGVISNTCSKAQPHVWKVKLESESITRSLKEISNSMVQY